jgi:hypothetical protein
LLLRVFYIPTLYYTIYKLHIKYNFPRFCSCRSVHVHSCRLLLMRACARRAYYKKYRLNLGSKRSGWPNIPDLIWRFSNVFLIYTFRIKKTEHALWEKRIKNVFFRFLLTNKKKTFLYFHGAKSRAPLETTNFKISRRAE